MEKAGDAAGMGEMQLERDAFVVQIFREGLELGRPEEELAVVEGVDKEFGEGVTLRVGTGLELVDIVRGGAAFFEYGFIAGPVSSLEADLADGCRVDLL